MIRQDYAPPLFQRTKTKLERIVNSPVGFIVFITFIILGGGEWS